MIIIPTWINASSIHGQGCFSGKRVSPGELVWVYSHAVDRILPGNPSRWERLHAYGSNANPGRLVLPGDNGAWINFSEKANLAEAEAINGEFCLRACREIKPCEEITVFVESDADADWKIQCTKEEDSSLTGSLGRLAETVTLPFAFSASEVTSWKAPKISRLRE